MYTIHLNDLPQTMQTLVRQVISDHEPIRISSPSLPENVVLVPEAVFSPHPQPLSQRERGERK